MFPVPSADGHRPRVSRTSRDEIKEEFDKNGFVVLVGHPGMVSVPVNSVTLVKKVQLNASVAYIEPKMVALYESDKFVLNLTRDEIEKLYEETKHRTQ